MLLMLSGRLDHLNCNSVPSKEVAFSVDKLCELLVAHLQVSGVETAE